MSHDKNPDAPAGTPGRARATLAAIRQMAGSRKGDTVMDPFAGSGTVGKVALEQFRSFVGVELSPVYAAMAQRRLDNVDPLLRWAGGAP
jgi:DNA modification methylase